MDKARITYRFDRREDRSSDVSRTGEKDRIISLKPEDFEVLEETPTRSAHSLQDSYWLNQFTSDYGAWQSPFDVETQKLEQLIRESDSDHPHPRKKSEYGPARTAPLPFRNEGYEDEKRVDEAPWGEMEPRASYRKNDRFPWVKMTSSITGAIVTGVLFGFLALSWFSGGHGVESGSGNLLSSASSGLGQESANGLETPGAAGSSQSSVTSPVDGSGAVQVHISSQTYYLLQNGVFSNQQGADAAKSELRKQGFAAAAEGAEYYSVYAGVTMNRDDALWLSHRLEESQFEVYIKALTLPEIHQLKWNSNGVQNLDPFISSGNDLVGTMDGLTIRLLEDERRTSIDVSAIEPLRKQHQAWLDLANTVKAGAPLEINSVFEEMVNAMNAAMISLEEYNKNPSEAALWQIQTELMEYVLAENDVLTSLSQ